MPPAARTSNVLGGPYNGFSPIQTYNNAKSSEQVMSRRVLTKSWNTAYATGSYNNRNRVITPFRAVNNLGDFLGRTNYVCGGPNPITADRNKRLSNMGSILSRCDGSGVPASSCNVKFVPDSSDYITFKKQRAMNQNYNDLSNGGDQSNASYVPMMAVRRF
jgi:hypothetical protein